MASPTLYDVFADPILTNASIKYRNENYIAEKVFKPMQVAKKSGYYFVYDTSGLRLDNAYWGPVSRAPRVEYNVTKTAYGPLVKVGYEEAVDYDIIEQADKPLDPMLDATLDVTEKLLAYKENNLSVLLNSTSRCPNYTTLSGTTQWSDFTNSVPFENVQTGIDTVVSKSGFLPNTIVMGWQVFAKLRNHPDLLERMKYDGSAKGALTAQQIADALGVQNIFVGSAIKEGADEGQTSSPSFIWGKHAWLMYVPQSPTLRTPAAGYCLQLGAARKVETWDEPQVAAKFVRCSDYFENKITSTAAIYFIQNAVA